MISPVGHCKLLQLLRKCHESILKLTYDNLEKMTPVQGGEGVASRLLVNQLTRSPEDWQLTEDDSICANQHVN